MSKLTVGTRVEIFGLSKGVAFNGQTGKVEQFYTDKQRYGIALEDPKHEGKVIALKRANLRELPGGGMGGGDMAESTIASKARGLLSEFVRSQEVFPKKVFNVLLKMLKDNIEGVAKPLKEDNKILQERIFCFPQVVEFLKLAGYQSGKSGWTIPVSDEKRLNDLISAIQETFQEALAKEEAKREQETYEELAFEVKTLTPMSGIYDDMGDVQDGKPVYKCRKRRIKCMRKDGYWEFHGKQGVMRIINIKESDKQHNWPMTNRGWILTAPDGTTKEFPSVVITKVESFLMGVQVSAADPLRAAQAASGLTQSDVLGSYDRRERCWNPQVVLIEAVYNKKLNMGSGFLIQDCRKPASFIEQDCRWVATAAHCVSFFNDGIKQYTQYRVRVLKKSWRGKDKLAKVGFGPREAMKKGRFKDYMVSADDIFVYSPYEKHATPYWGTDFALIRLPDYHTLRLLTPLVKWNVNQEHPLEESVMYKSGQKPRYHEVVGFPANTTTEKTYVQYTSSKLVRKCPKRDRHKATHALGEEKTDFGFHHFYSQDGKHYLARYMSQTSAGMSGGGLVCNERIIGVHVLGGNSEIHGASIVSKKIYKWITTMQKKHSTKTDAKDIHQAARLGDNDAIQKFLEEGVAVDTPDESDMTALLYACIMGQESTVNVLLEGGADPKQSVNRKKIVLLGTGTEPRRISLDDLTPLHCAAYTGQTKICKILIDRGADVNATTSWKETPLHFCARGIAMDQKKSPNAACAEMLLDNGAKIGEIEAWGKTPLMLAIIQSQIKMVETLLKRGADPAFRRKGKESCLNYAAEVGDLDIFEMILAQDGVEIDDCIENGPTALMAAVVSGQDPIVAKALQMGASAMIQANDTLPLARAIQLEHYVCANAIINAGTSIDSVSLDETKTPMLFHAISKKGIEFFDERKANLNAQDANGNTLTHILVQKQNADAALFLEEVDVDLNTPNNDGLTPNQLAISLGYSQMFYTICLIGADTNVVHKEYGNLLHMGAFFNCPLGGTYTTIKPNEKFNGKTALHIAVEKGHMSFLEDFLSNSEIDVTIEDDEGRTAMDIAEAHDDKDIKEEMIKLLKK